MMTFTDAVRKFWSSGCGVQLFIARVMVKNRQPSWNWTSGRFCRRLLCVEMKLTSDKSKTHENQVWGHVGEDWGGVQPPPFAFRATHGICAELMTNFWVTPSARVGYIQLPASTKLLIAGQNGTTSTDLNTKLKKKFW